MGPACSRGDRPGRSGRAAAVAVAHNSAAGPPRRPSPPRLRCLRSHEPRRSLVLRRNPRLPPYKGGCSRVGHPAGLLGRHRRGRGMPRSKPWRTGTVAGHAHRPTLSRWAGARGLRQSQSAKAGGRRRCPERGMPRPLQWRPSKPAGCPTRLHHVLPCMARGGREGQSGVHG